MGMLISAEAAAIPVEPGTGTIKVTGVMDEEEIGGAGRTMRGRSQARSSVDNVITVLRSVLKLRPQDYDIHINFPGGVPIDGPSAGVTMVTAVYSALTNKQVDNTVAMTGEVTIHGLVQPVGGIVPKVTAARESGVKRVLIPAENWLEMFAAWDDIEVIPITHVAEAIRAAIVGAKEPHPTAHNRMPDVSVLAASNAKLTP